MKRNLAILVAFLPFFFSCAKKTCNLVCTADFRSVVILTQDKGGKPLAALQVNAVNTRTKKKYLDIKSEPSPVNNAIVYLIATDNQRSDFSEKGDQIAITLTTSTTTLNTEFVIAGGACSCHILKISGPNIIVID